MCTECVNTNLKHIELCPHSELFRDVSELSSNDFAINRNCPFLIKFEITGKQ